MVAPELFLNSAFIIHSRRVLANGRRSSRFPSFKVEAIHESVPYLTKILAFGSILRSHAHLKKDGRYCSFMSYLQNYS